MKTTIKLGASKSLTVEPCARLGGVLATVNMNVFGVSMSEAIHLTPDQCGALIFGLEQAGMGDQRGAAYVAARAGFEASAG